MDVWNWPLAAGFVLAMSVVRRRIVQVLSGVSLGILATLALLGRGAAPEPVRAPDVALTADDGTEESLTDLRGSWAIVFFGFTHCPDVCPVSLRRLAAGLRHLDEAGGRSAEAAARFEVRMVTVDPERDTPERLRAFLAEIRPSFRGLTGSEDQLALVWDAFDIRLDDPLAESGHDASGGHDAHADAPEGDAGTETGAGASTSLSHSASLFILDPSGRLAGTLPPWPTPADMADELLRVLDGR